MIAEQILRLWLAFAFIAAIMFMHTIKVENSG